MKPYKFNFSSDPSFNTVTGLSNTTFNPTVTVENRMATEAQIQELYRDIVAAEQRRDYCCRDIIVWETHTQIVRLNNNTMLNTSDTKDSYFSFSSGGVVVSTFEENVNIGTMRRGLAYTVTFPVKWDNDLYFAYTPMRTGENSIPYESSSNSDFSNHNLYAHTQVEYRYAEDKTYLNNKATQITNANRVLFFENPSNTPSTSSGMQSNQASNKYQYSYDNLTRARIARNWNNFTIDIKDDGTVTIRDNRRNTNFNIIYFYTQYTLNRCANGTLLSDAASARLALWNQNHPNNQFVMGENIFVP